MSGRRHNERLLILIVFEEFVRFYDYVCFVRIERFVLFEEWVCFV